MGTTCQSREPIEGSTFRAVAADRNYLVIKCACEDTIGPLTPQAENLSTQEYR